jgi:hypothetical protein
MKYLLLSLRFIFGSLSVIFFLGLIASIYLYVANGEVGTINKQLILELVIFTSVSVFLTFIFNLIYDRKAYQDDRLIRREDLQN